MELAQQGVDGANNPVVVLNNREVDLQIQIQNLLEKTTKNRMNVLKSLKNLRGHFLGF